MKRCYYCGRSIDPERDHCYQGVSGWEEYGRRAGGTHAIVGRKPKDLWCCDECARKIKRGVSVAQEQLV